MTTTVKLRKLLHRKAAEYLAPLYGASGPMVTTTGACFGICKPGIIPINDFGLYIGSTTIAAQYSPAEDSWTTLTGPGGAGTFGNGTALDVRTISAPGGVQNIPATAGSTTTLTTALTLAMNLSGIEIRVVAGSGIGYIGTIKKNTMGTNSVITVTTASAVAFDSTTRFNVYACSAWFFCPGTPAGFNVYDRMTNTWTARSVTGLAGTFASETFLISTLGAASNRGLGFVTGTATAGSTTTLTDSAKTWPVNGFANSQVRITGGTGNGQIAVITSNTATVLTVPTLTTALDATSTYIIEGNDDVIYLLGNSVVTLYKYTISTNTWATLSPTAARAGNMASGGNASWISGVKAAHWTDGTYGRSYSTLLHQNGRYIYSFRGSVTTLDVYDIALNTWVSAVPYAGSGLQPPSGSCSVDMDGLIYILGNPSYGQIIQFDVANHIMQPFTINLIPQGSTLAGSKLMALASYIDGSTEIDYLYSLNHSKSDFVRWLII